MRSNDSGNRAYKTSFDPDAKRTSQILPTDTIREIYLAVMQERPNSIGTAGEGWLLLAAQHGKTLDDLARKRATLRESWTGDAFTTFDDSVVDTQKSLLEWQSVARMNGNALWILRNKVANAQRHMADLWDKFNQDIGAAKQQDDGSDWNPAELWRDLGDSVIGRTRLDPIVKKYTQLAIEKVLNPLNDAYKEAYLATTQGSVFIGPTNAVRPTQQQMASALGLTDGIGDLPGLPGSMGTGSLGIGGALGAAAPQLSSDLDSEAGQLAAFRAEAGSPALASPPTPTVGQSALPRPVGRLGLPPSLGTDAIPDPSMGLDSVVPPSGLGLAEPTSESPSGIDGQALDMGGLPGDLPTDLAAGPSDSGMASGSQIASDAISPGLRGRIGALPDGLDDKSLGAGSGAAAPPLQDLGGPEGALRPPQSGAARNLPEVPPMRPSSLMGRNRQGGARVGESEATSSSLIDDEENPFGMGRLSSPDLFGIRRPGGSIRSGIAGSDAASLPEGSALSGRFAGPAQLPDDGDRTAELARLAGLGGRGSVPPAPPAEPLPAIRPPRNAASGSVLNREKRRRTASAERALDPEPDLFSAGETPPAVIETPAERRPHAREGRALGLFATATSDAGALGGKRRNSRT